MTQRIDLSGPSGNAYALAATCKNWERQLGNKRFTNILQADSYNGVLINFIERFRDRVDFVLVNAPAALVDEYPDYCEASLDEDDE